jgi:GNAT superfamily N-acetyltransferase
MADHLNVSIVRAEHEHLDQLVPLFDAYRVFYEQPSDPGVARRFLTARLSKLESVVFLALAEGPEGGGLGFCQLYPSFTSVEAARIWILYDLFVLPEARQRGLGRALMERARHFAQATGASRLELSTAKDNRPAQVLYESLGYERDEAFYFYELGL